MQRAHRWTRHSQRASETDMLRLSRLAWLSSFLASVCTSACTENPHAVIASELIAALDRGEDADVIVNLREPTSGDRAQRTTNIAQLTAQVRANLADTLQVCSCERRGRVAVRVQSVATSSRASQRPRGDRPTKARFTQRDFIPVRTRPEAVAAACPSLETHTVAQNTKPRNSWMRVHTQFART